MLLYCGANIREFKDTRYPTIAGFVRATRRLNANEWTDAKIPDRPIVVLTNTNYRELVVNRTEIIKALPALTAALWVAFADPDENPFFFKYAIENGTFNDGSSDVPIWIETRMETNYRYLILTPDVKNMNLVEIRASELNLLNATTWHQRESPSTRQSTQSSTNIRTLPQPNASGSGTYKFGR